LIPLEGKSFLPVLKGGTRAGHEKLYLGIYRQSRLAYGRHEGGLGQTESQEWELYNLAKDRTETQNLAAEQPETVDKMVADWMAWAEEMGVPVK
jgi:arylsulfatase A-like enzyme